MFLYPLSSPHDKYDLLDDDIIVLRMLHSLAAPRSLQMVCSAIESYTKMELTGLGLIHVASKWLVNLSAYNGKHRKWGNAGGFQPNWSRWLCLKNHFFESYALSFISFLYWWWDFTGLCIINDKRQHLWYAYTFGCLDHIGLLYSASIWQHEIQYHQITHAAFLQVSLTALFKHNTATLHCQRSRNQT